MNPIDTNTETLKCWVRWLTRDDEAKEKIRERFGIQDYNTLNGLTPAEIKPIDRQIFEETARIGFFSIINSGWSENGGKFSLLSR